ncbi:MAG TPA: peptidylprolyl isomerase [Dehalococcoidia bacterium]
MRLFSSQRIFYLIGALVVLAMVIPAGFVLALGGGSSGRPDLPFVTPEPTQQETPAAGTPTPSDQPAPRRYTQAPAMAIDPARQYTATIRTEKGEVRLQLFAAEAPVTVNNFVFLAREGFYNGLTFHRVLPGLLAQAGDPAGDGTGNAGYTIPDERTDRPVTEGAVAMAKRREQADTASSQFFIALGDLSYLNGQVTVFGQVVEGMDVLRALTPRDPQQDPNAPPGDRILTVEIQEQ